jgi:hypothetical protein
MTPLSETSDIQDTDWNREIHKWQYGIDVAEATQEDLNMYTQAKTHEYELYSKMDSDLWDLFQDDFKDFDKNVFSQVARRHLQELRTCLRGRGVYVAPNNKRTTIAQTLSDVIAEEEQHQWTDEDIEATIKELVGPMHTRALRDRLNQTFDGLATGLKPAQLTTTTTTPPRTQNTQPPSTQDQLLTLFTQLLQTQNQQSLPAATTSTNAQQPAQQQHNPQQTAQQQYNPQQPAQQHTLPQSTLQQPLDLEGAASYKKEAATVAKMYTDSQKYDGVN